MRRNRASLFIEAAVTVLTILAVVMFFVLIMTGCDMRAPGTYMYVSKPDPVYVIEESDPVETVLVLEETHVVCHQDDPPFYAAAKTCTEYGIGVGVCCTWEVDYVDFYGYHLQTCLEEYCWWDDMCYWEEVWSTCYH